MHPFRAFLFSMTGGFAILLSAQGLFSVMQPAPDQRIGHGPLHVPSPGPPIA